MIRIFKNAGTRPQAKGEVRALIGHYFFPRLHPTEATPQQPFCSFWKGGRRLKCFFDADWYLSQNPGLERGVDPLTHYLKVGEAAGFAPNWRFDPVWYRSQYPDVAASGLGALRHFVKVGLEEGRAPQARHPDLARLFDPKWYLQSFKHEKRPKGDLLNHYLYSGEAKRRSPLKFFDNEHYLAKYPALNAKEAITPLEHFLLVGHAEGASPSKAFDLAFYFKAYPESVQAQANGLLHYLSVGMGKGHLPRHHIPELRSVFDPLHYRQQFPPDEVPPEGQEFEHYLEQGHRRFNPNPMFDTLWYLKRHPELEAQQTNPLEHYLHEGESAGEPPSEQFDPAWYWKRNRDVLAAGVSPLAHYLLHGAAEKRLPRRPRSFLHSADMQAGRTAEVDREQLPWNDIPDLRSVFDPLHYRQQLSRNEGPPPGQEFEHYLTTGHQTFDPNPMFDTLWYLKRNPELKARPITPLEHYLHEGESAGQPPSAKFDPVWYWKRNRDVQAAGVSPLAHYLLHGAAEKRLPRRPRSVLRAADLHACGTAEVDAEQPPWNDIPDLRSAFDPLYYRQQLPLGESPPPGQELEHYLTKGHQTINPNPVFDTLWYLERHPELKVRHLNPLEHYLHEGEGAGQPPSEAFDPAWYWDRNRDVRAAGISPLVHYLAHGASEKRMPRRPRLFFANASDLRTYLAECPPHLKPWPSLVDLAVSSLPELAALPDGAGSCTEVYASADVTLESLAPLAYPTTAQVFHLRNPWVVAGTRYLISGTNSFVHDESAHFFEEDQAHEKYNSATKRRAAGSVQIEVGLRQGAWVGPAIHLMHEYDNNYFHFLTETATRLQLIDEAGIDPAVPLLVAADLHPNLVDLLARLNLSQRPLYRLERGTVYQVERLFYPTDRSVVVDAYEGGTFARQSGLDVARIARAVRSVLSPLPEAPAGDKIFAIRHSRMRALINQTEIGERLQALGFKIVDASVMDLDEQIQAFRAASVVVAPTGAQLTNIVWCRPRTQVWVLASDHPSHQLYLWELLGRVSGAVVSHLLGPRANTVTGLHGVHDDYRMSLPLILSALAQAG